MTLGGTLAPVNLANPRSPLMIELCAESKPRPLHMELVGNAGVTEVIGTGAGGKAPETEETPCVGGHIGGGAIKFGGGGGGGSVAKLYEPVMSRLLYMSGTPENFGCGGGRG
ncbi:unnamed protein product [Soboliphyme baturini]|uniref:Fumerase domain-containing protein n=1 Tax=Soboliphyme baturini TaxID=241478 RepID=A0A183J7F8_9BILA|nr:unnamed protein product [Soboliphyme baturini]